ncbi:DnaJ-domain-containing protein [Polychaeton citri CBS 116435]|uniref:DnaJ-domain-containing protein n=1 Tax=Polychaeton citri CBS 116435 TaxID=1314669 RepID=A0A9P4UMS1_9PEZI|nr:DnaJ-domain-containing protein [Polychaeton citri CBS 116435]
MIVRSCLTQRTTRSCLSTQSPTCPPPIIRNRHPTIFGHCFRTTRPNFDGAGGLPNHYETLDLPTNASATDVKKQFYKLSKSHHPDLHPNDTTASQRFVKISEAYATLGSMEKRARYDHDFLRATGEPSSAADIPRGSYSSASPAGGRPASGLSKRRTKFHGPPPSFYQSGGWGAYGAKREEAARNASHAHEAQGRAQSGPTGPAGTGPGGFAFGFDNDVPHFDRKGHYQTHSTIEKTRHKARRKQETADELHINASGGMMLNFFVVCGMLGFIYSASLAIGVMWSAPKKQKQEA